MSRSLRPRVATRAGGLMFEPLEQRRVLAGAGIEDGGMVSVSKMPTGVQGALQVVIADSTASFLRVDVTTVHSGGTLNSGMPAFRITETPAPAANLTIAGRTPGGLGEIVSTAVSLPLQALPVTSTDSSPGSPRDGGTISMSQALSPWPIDLPTTASRTALDHRSGLVAGRSTPSMITGEMARGVVVEQVSAVGAPPEVASFAAFRPAQAPANSPLIAEPILRRSVERTADEGKATLPVATPASATRATPAGFKTEGRWMPSAIPVAPLGVGSVVSAEDHPPVPDQTDGAEPDGLAIAAAPVPPEINDGLWKRLVNLAPVVILVVVQKFLDDKLTKGANQADNPALSQRQPGCWPWPVRQRSARPLRRTRSA